MVIYRNGITVLPSTATLVVAASNSLHPERADYVCDGTADNVTIQLAIDGLPAGGKVILLDGTYEIIANIVIPDNTIIEGVGWSTILQTKTGETDIQILTNDDWVGGNSNIVIRNLQLDGNRGAGSDTREGGLAHLVTCSNCLIEYVYSHHGRCHGIEITQSTNITIQNCYADDDGDDGISLDDGGFAPGGGNGDSISRDIDIISCIATNHDEGTGAGFEINDGVERVNYYACTASGNNRGFDIHTHAANIAPDHVTYDCCRSISNINLGSANVYDGAGFVNWAENTVDTANNVTYTDCKAIDNEGIGISSKGGFNIKISNCFVDTGYTPGGGLNNKRIGIFVDGHANDIASQISIINSKILNAGYRGIFIRALTNTISEVKISGNYIDNCALAGILVTTATAGREINKVNISNNTLKNNNREANASVENDCGIGIYADKEDIDGVTIRDNHSYDDQGGKTQGYGLTLREALTKEITNIIIEGNDFRENDHDPIFFSESRDLELAYRKHTDLFMDVLAISATAIRSNEDLSAGIPITFTLDAQPDIPRTLSGHFDAHAQITEYDIEIKGIDAKGIAVTETKDEGDGWDWETDNAFAIITSIKMTARTGTGVGDTMDIGVTDVLGLSNRIYETSDVFKIKKNNANATVAGAQVNTTYDTYDMAVIGLAGADDFTIWYKSNLNIIA